MEPTPQVLAAEHVLFLCAIVLGAGTVLTYVAERTKVPDIVLYLLAGIALGPAGAGAINVGTGSTMYQVVLLFGASYILFDGGVAMRLEVLKRVWPTVLLLATAGVLITTAICGFAAAMIFAVPFPVAFLIGAVISSTDPAALIPVFRQVEVRDRLRQTIVAESACNDAIAAILTFTLLALVGGAGVNLWHAARDMVWEAAAGVAIGAAAGYVMCITMAHHKFGILRDNLTLGTLIVVIGAVLASAHYQASGFMAVFVAGIILGNRSLFGFSISAAEDQRLQQFIETTGLIMRMFIFTLLGAQADLDLLRTYAIPALALVMVLVLIARPLVVFGCALPDRRAKWSYKELLFMCWTRETGVIPAALAGMLEGRQVPHSELITVTTFMAVLVTIGGQATTAGWVGRRLGIVQT